MPHDRRPLDQLRIKAAFTIAALWGLTALVFGCTSMAELTTLSDPGCHEALSSGLAKILADQSEAPDVALQLAQETVVVLSSADLGPRPFLIAAPSGTDYTFFIEKKNDACLLRLYGRQKGFVSYTNNITYIATERLGPCQCAE